MLLNTDKTSYNIGLDIRLKNKLAVSLTDHIKPFSIKQVQHNKRKYATNYFTFSYTHFL